jgi:hypothetical protein
MGRIIVDDETWFPLQDKAGTWLDISGSIRLYLNWFNLAVVLSLLFCTTVTLYEKRADICPKRKDGNWINTMLTSKMAVAVIVWANLVASACCIISNISSMLITGNASMCNFWMKSVALFYVLSLWATYILFLARGMMTSGGIAQRGWKHIVTLLVQVGTATTPIFGLLAIYAANGTIYGNHCVPNVLPAISIAVMVADSSLSVVGL